MDPSASEVNQERVRQTSERRSGPTRHELVRRSLTVSKAGSVAVLVFTVLTAIGWLLDIPVFTSGRLTPPPTQLSIAVALAASAAAVFLTAGPPTPRWRRATAIVLAFC